MFEEVLCEFLGVKYVLVFNSVILVFLMFYRNFSEFSVDCNEIIIIFISFVVMVNMFLESGYIFVFVGIKNDGNIDELVLEKFINERIKVIVSVDYVGKSVEVESV